MKAKQNTPAEPADQPTPETPEVVLDKNGRPLPEALVRHRWKKGQSGNPAGKPRGLPNLETALAKFLGEERDGKSGLDVIIEALRAKAAKGDTKSASLLLDRAYGKAKETVAMDVTTDGEKINAAPQLIIINHRAPGETLKRKTE